jgi:hypothetical protein
VIITGTLVKTARVFDDEFVEGDVIEDPARFIANLPATGLCADLLTFPQKLHERTPRHPYFFELDNAAAAHTSEFDAWWRSLPQESRKNARRAQKRGVIVRPAVFDEEFVKGVKSIYDEVPIRQSRRFWHYGKALELVARENATYADRSEFIGAYYQEQLIGFIKFVYVDRVANMMQILSKAAHYDKRPMNALIAKAVELCSERGIEYLVYGKFAYGNKRVSQLAEFKRRNGFCQMEFPRYFIPLSAVGRWFVRMRLHRGIVGLLPGDAMDFLWRIRAAIYHRRGAH